MQRVLGISPELSDVFYQCETSREVVRLFEDPDFKWFPVGVHYTIFNDRQIQIVSPSTILQP